MLRHEAALPEHSGLACALVGPHNIPQVFRIQAVGQRRGSHKVAEQHTDVPAFCLMFIASNRMERFPAASAKARGGGILEPA
jgi:hypothetical protein